MRYIDLLKFRDRSIKTELLNKLTLQQRSSIKEPLENAFKEGSLLWAEKYLPILIGAKQAKEVIRKMEDELT